MMEALIKIMKRKKKENDQEKRKGETDK